MSTTDICLVIPARFGSTRFPGKPLAPVRGISLLERTWRLARSVANIREVVIATDDERIREHAGAFGATVVMTSGACRNGTERVLDCVQRAPAAMSHVINLQGDAVLTPPWIIQSVVDALIAGPRIEMITPAVRMSWAAYEELIRAKGSGEVGGTTVVFDSGGNALYFSKAVIPFLRKTEKTGSPPVFRHIGLYGYALATLEKLVGLPPSPLEQVEQLEQLRALENGIRIQVVQVDYRGRTHWSIDTPEDLRRVEGIIDREGELVA